MTYRPEIDGLRAVAVLAVIVFHAAPGVLPGGFLGVDVFFVISGYLITGILLAANDVPGRTLWSVMAQFWMRRIRRILPALLLCLAGTLALGAAVLAPADYDSLARSALAAAFSVSNIWFWRQPRGYFHDDIGDAPLVHTWSLAVEEQFYILYPVGLLLVLRYRPALVLPLLAAGTVASFSLAQFATERSSDAAFYLLPTRAWQLGVGALVWLLVEGRGWRAASDGKRAIGAVLPLIGMAAIAVSFAAIDKGDAIPAAGALPATLGAALFVGAASAQTGPGRWLAMRLPVAIGLISFSLYLWHQPLLALSRAAFADLPYARSWIALAAIACSFAIAWASWRFVERPFRSAARPARQVLVPVAAALALVVAGSGIVMAANGLPERLDPAARQMVAVAQQEETVRLRKARCALREKGWRTPVGHCALPRGLPPRIAVVGDSHAATLLERAGEIAGKAGGSATLLFAPGCMPPGLAPDDRRGIRRCEMLPGEVSNWLERHPDVRVILVAYHWNQLVTQGRRFDPTPRQRAHFENYLANLAGDDRRVVLLDPLPMAHVEGSHAAFAAYRFGRWPANAVGLQEHRERVAPILEFLDGIAIDTVSRIDATARLCDMAQGTCRLSIGEDVLYRDEHHLTRAGARRALPVGALNRVPGVNDTLRRPVADQPSP